MSTHSTATCIAIVFSERQHPDEQHRIDVRVDLPCTVIQAIDASNLMTLYPQLDLTCCAIGIYGQLVTMETHLRPDDRIEIYRPLRQTHHEARRQRVRRTPDKKS